MVNVFIRDKAREKEGWGDMFMLGADMKEVTHAFRDPEKAVQGQRPYASRLPSCL